MAATDHSTRLAKVMARANDGALLGVIDTLAAPGRTLSEPEKLTLTWVMGELERRHPECDDAIDAWVEAQPDDERFTQAALALAMARIYREAGVR